MAVSRIAGLSSLQKAWLGRLEVHGRARARAFVMPKGFIHGRAFIIRTTLLCVSWESLMCLWIGLRLASLVYKNTHCFREGVWKLYIDNFPKSVSEGRAEGLPHLHPWGCHETHVEAQRDQCHANQKIKCTLSVRKDAPFEDRYFLSQLIGYYALLFIENSA